MNSPVTPQPAAVLQKSAADKCKIGGWHKAPAQRSCSCAAVPFRILGGLPGMEGLNRLRALPGIVPGPGIWCGPACAVLLWKNTGCCRSICGIAADPVCHLHGMVLPVGVDKLVDEISARFNSENPDYSVIHKLSVKLNTVDIQIIFKTHDSSFDEVLFCVPFSFITMRLNLTSIQC